MDLSYLDYFLILFYFFIVFFVAYKVSKQSQDKKSADTYFLAGRDLTWFAIGASLFASNIGSEHLVGLAGAGASSGIAVAQFEIFAGIILLLLGWVFVPFYLQSGVATMPEFLEYRYGSGARLFLSIISVIAYVFTKISVTIYAGALIFEAMGIPFWLGAAIVVCSTGIYTILGGLRAVIYTDVLQMFIMIIGSLILMAYGLQAVGGIEKLFSALPDEYLKIWRNNLDPQFPWLGILFGAPILGVWYWCTDQFIVQRVLSAKNIQEARRGTLFGGFLKMTPLFIFVFPGLICYVLAQQNIVQLPSSDKALPVLIAALLPNGLKGIVIAGLLAALMSSLSTVFNSCSTLITYDFYKKMRPSATDKELISVGQIATLILIGLGLMWIPFMGYISNQLFHYLQSIQAYISPPIAAVFLLGVFSRRLNYAGAMACLSTGFMLGMLRLILELNKHNLTGFWLGYATINFLYFACFLFVVCSAVLIGVSLLSSRPNYETIAKITFSKDSLPALSISKVDVLLSMGLILTITMIWYIYS